MSAPRNPLLLAPHALGGSATNQDFVLVNGGWQPQLAMQARQTGYAHRQRNVQDMRAARMGSVN